MIAQLYIDMFPVCCVAIQAADGSGTLFLNVSSGVAIMTAEIVPYTHKTQSSILCWDTIYNIIVLGQNVYCVGTKSILFWNKMYIVLGHNLYCVGTK